MKRQIYKLVLFKVFLSLCIYGCKKGCSNPKGNTGIIVKSLSYNDLFCWELKEDKFLITNDSAYKAIFQIDSLHTNCKGVKPEEIDFSQYSLLGFYAAGGNTDFLRNVIRKDSEKKVIYELTENNCSGTKEAIISPNLVLIPKVPEDYSAEFILK